MYFWCFGKNRLVCHHQSEQQQKSVCAKNLWKKSLVFSSPFLLFIAGDNEAKVHVVNIKLEKMYDIVSLAYVNIAALIEMLKMDNGNLTTATLTL